ncbi:hypothetical protein C4J81_12495 [Deltaproteobacteria bacterium Smac51]|nr:hypothetical protein C4J81_12495 [Deltaproteobacteria bacterium Smac51]
MFLPCSGSVGFLVTSPGKNISSAGCLVSFFGVWEAGLVEWEPEAGDCFYPGSVTKDPRNGTGIKTIPGFRRVNGIKKL